MAVELLRNLRTGRTYARFVVDGHWDDRDVSVVGPFNDWTPGIDVLRPDRDGTRSALVEIDEGADVQFRYLATGDDWFDDPEADEFSERGSTVYWSRPEPNGAANGAAKKTPAKKAAAKSPAKAANGQPAKKSPAKKAPAAKRPMPAKGA